MRRLLTALLWVPLVSCGGGGGGGGAAPTPTVTGIAITGPEGPYLVGSSYTFSATVTLSNGQTQAASGTWGGDAPTVGTMANGLFAGVSPGEVTIWIDVTQGGRATKRLRVHPSYNGPWVGSYRITSCTDSGQFRSSARFCRDILTVGETLELGLQLVQNGLTVSSTVFLGGIELDPASSTVGDDGRLQIDARVTEDSTTLEVTLQLQQPQPTSLAGTITQNWRDTSLTGSARVTGDLVDVTKLTGAAAVPMRAPAPSLLDRFRAAKR